MKKAFHIIVLLLLCGLATKEQVITGTNLVNNPSFEEYYGCPTYAAQLYECKYWWGFSSDYFNACATVNSNVSVPYSGAGFQYAHTGVAYAGFIIYSHNPFDLDYI